MKIMDLVKKLEEADNFIEEYVPYYTPRYDNITEDRMVFLRNENEIYIYEQVDGYIRLYDMWEFDVGNRNLADNGEAIFRAEIEDFVEQEREKAESKAGLG